MDFRLRGKKVGELGPLVTEWTAARSFEWTVGSREGP
jgi:hypothetical protein